MKRMQNLGKHLGFREDAQILWLGCWELGMPMGFFWFFHCFWCFFMKGDCEVFCWELVPLTCFHNVDGVSGIQTNEH